MKWFQQLWIKLAIQAVTVILLWITYYVFRHLVPKKYRLHDSTIKKFLRDFGSITGNITKDDDGIGDVLQKSKNVFDYFYDQRSRMKNTDYEFKLFIRDLTEEVTVYNNHTFANMILPRIEHLGKYTVVHEIDSLHHCVKVEFDDPDSSSGGTINIYLIKTANERNDQTSYHSSFAVSKGMRYQKLTNLLFGLYDNRLYLTVKHDLLLAEKLEQNFNQENYILPEKMFNALRDEIRNFRARGIQRSYILYGPPGCGKTTMSLELSKQVSGKILKLDAKVFSDLANHQTKSIIEGLDCDFILVDDIDRIMVSDLSSFLYMLEALKDFTNKPTLLATINTLKRMDPAILRPGRFDDIIEFKLPNESDRFMFFKNMTGKLGVEVPDLQLKKLAKATANMSHAFMKEYCLQLLVETDVDLVVEKIERRQKYLEQVGSESSYEMEYEEELDEPSQDDD